MTDWFEVTRRDGAARRGELRLEEPLATPALVDDVIADAGSRWAADREPPEGDPAALTVVPHRGLPAGTPDEVQSAFAPRAVDVEYPHAQVVSADTAADLGADAYVLSGAQGLVGHASAFVDAVVSVRETIPDDAALYLPGVATPRNVGTLVYAGVDLVDSDAAVVAGTRGRYLTVDGDRRLSDLRELTCPCPACDVDVDKFDREACAEHNERALRAALATVRERVRTGQLRDHLEAQARHGNWLTGVLRRLDDRWGYLEPRTPVFRTRSMRAASADSIRRVEVRRFADRVTSRYRCRFDEPLVLVPCSATKPYSESQSHGQFRDVIDYRAHVVSMTSPIGVVPQELELTYPAQHYDAVVTGRWTETEVSFVADVLSQYLDRTDYDRVVAHVPPDGYREVVERATADRDLPVEFTVAEHPTDDDSLAALADALEGELQYGRRARRINTVRAIADWQFGDGAGDALFPEVRLESRYPKLRVHDPDGTQLAAMVPQYGTLSLTLPGARRWAESEVPTHRVAIDDFVPHGSVLAPGVTDADAAIRVGDEVVVEGPSAFAVGRAEMHGHAMDESTRGVAVDVRHVEER